MRVPGLRQRRWKPVISTLPSVIKLNAEEDGAAEWIRSTFQYAAAEVAAGRPGSEAVLAKLSELLFVEAVRRYADARRRGKPAGSPVCATATSRERWLFCIAILPAPGR